MPSYSSSMSGGEDEDSVTSTSGSVATQVVVADEKIRTSTPSGRAGTTSGPASSKRTTRVTIGDILRGEHGGSWTPGTVPSPPASSFADQHGSLKPANVTAAFKLVQEARTCAKADRIDIPSNIEDEYMLNMKLIRRGDASNGSKSSTSNTQERSSSIKPVLDWLYVSQGHLTPMQLADLSSKMALSRVHVIDVGSMNTLKEAIADGVLWMGANRLPSAPVRVAAYLNRLKHRFKQRFNDGKSIVIMTYSSSASYLTLHALALFFYMYCYMNHTDSRTLAAAAVEKQIPPVSILESGIEELAVCGKGWLERVQIEWPYGAQSAVDICGEICGGWHVTRHLYYHPARKTWRIQLWGLPPGSYSFKYVVDGQWCVDLKKPMISDEYGNDNNMATVLACGGLERKDQIIVDEMDGMAASFVMGGASDGNSNAMATVELMEYDPDGSASPMEGRKMVVVVPDAGPERTRDGSAQGGISGDAQARLRLARLGSLLLSYYKKIRLGSGM